MFKFLSNFDSGIDVLVYFGVQPSTDARNCMDHFGVNLSDTGCIGNRPFA